MPSAFEDVDSTTKAVRETGAVFQTVLGMGGERTLSRCSSYSAERLHPREALLRHSGLPE